VQASINQVRPHLVHLMPLLASNLSPYQVSVCNNASWAIGEISVRLQAEELMPYVEAIMSKLVPIIINPNNDYNKPLLEVSCVFVCLHGSDRNFFACSSSSQSGEFVLLFWRLELLNHAGSSGNGCPSCYGAINWLLLAPLVRTNQAYP
jgi:hypothetical protein